MTAIGASTTATRARLALASVLALGPIAVLLLAGAAALARAGLAGWFALALAAAWFAAALLVRGLLAAPPTAAGPEASAAEAGARALVEAHVARVAEREPSTLAQPRALLEDALALAEAIARHFEPGASDPFARHTFPELAAAASLAFERLEQRIGELLPGSHLLTVAQWRRLARAPRWVARAGGALAAAFGARAEERRAPSSSRPNGLRADALATLHAAFLRELGSALIEMSAGRLRTGTAGHRAARAGEERSSAHGLPRILRQLRHARASWVRASR